MLALSKQAILNHQKALSKLNLGNQTHMVESQYIHGTSEREQQRLIQQASFLGVHLDSNLELHPGERLLEIGCGVGAVLGRIGLSCPEARLYGIDISDEQIHGARLYLNRLGLHPVELVVGDAAALPWPTGHMDRVRLVWVMEHLQNTRAVLREAMRVLRPGGTIHITETDYASLRTSPADESIEAMLNAFIAHFNRHGNAHAGPALGPWLEQMGFTNVSVQMESVHHWCLSKRQQMHDFCNYLYEFINPERETLLESEPNPRRATLIQNGFNRFKTLAAQADGSISISFYQARGTKP